MTFQPELLPGTKTNPPKEKVQKKPKKGGKTVFQQAIDLVNLRRKPVYNEPTEGENLDGELIDVTHTEDGRPVKVTPVHQTPPPREVPKNVENLARMIQQGTLRGNKPKEKSPTAVTHQRVNRRVGGIHVTGLAHDATQPQVGEQADMEGLHIMATIAHKVLQRKTTP